MLIDDWMPDYDFHEYHQTHVAAAPQVVYGALMRVDLLAHPIPLVLLGLRSLPALLCGRQTLRGGHRPFTLREARRFGFSVLEERAPNEVVLGVTGRFWRPLDGIEATDVVAFRDRVPAGRARAAWSFTASACENGGTLLATETRILCADEKVRRTFGRYWRVVRPGSGLIRRAMLAMVRRAAQAENASPV